MVPLAMPSGPLFRGFTEFMFRTFSKLAPIIWLDDF
jgi:hypothetical protein